MQFADKVVLITGGGSGMGAAAVELFAAAGAHVIAVDRDVVSAQRIAGRLAESHGRVEAAQADISVEADVERVVTAVTDRFGHIDVLFNNAGVGPSSHSRFAMAGVVDTPVDAWDAIMAINLKGPALMCKHVIPVMASAGSGVIVNNSSINALVAVPDADAYTASKGGLVALTRALAVQWAPAGIRVNCICPGPVDTPMNAPWLGNPEKVAFFNASIPMGRVATAHEVAEVALFLASDAASYITGTIIPVDGGWTAR